MRKTIILILATLIAASAHEAFAQTGNAVSSSSENKREIRLTPCNKDKGDDKSLFAEVEAWYDSSSRGRIYAAVKYNGKWKACIIETRTKE